MNEMTNSAQLSLAQLMLSRSAQLMPPRHLPRQLIGSEEYARDISKLVSFTGVPNKAFPSFVSAVASPSRSFSPPCSFSSLLPPEALIRNEVEGGRSKNNCTERISGI